MDQKGLELAVRWRDRYIRELSEALEGREEEARLLTAFLKCLLVRRAAVGASQGRAGTVRIAREELAAALEGYRVAVRAEEDAYLVRIEEAPGTEESAAPAEGAVPLGNAVREENEASEKNASSAKNAKNAERAASAKNMEACGAGAQQPPGGDG